ncbi:MAG: hypothetical protein KAU90_00950 [Sulfurovaceae bacterium]|nr:hypothetical protein [Sulfurovaceae bacterium]
MKEINISEELEKFLFNWFKKFEGKYIYFTTYDKIMRVFLVEEVALRKGRAKVKIGSCDIGKNEQSRCSWGLISNLRYKWNVVNKKELNKLLILENLE